MGSHYYDVEPTAVLVRLITDSFHDCDACFSRIKRGEFMAHLCKGASNPEQNETLCLDCLKKRQTAGTII